MAQANLNKRVLAVLEKEYGAYAVKIHGGPSQSATLDILACVWGRFIGVETKTGRDTLTPRQKDTIENIVAAKGSCIVAYSVEQLREGLAKLGIPHYPPPRGPDDAQNGHTS